MGKTFKREHCISHLRQVWVWPSYKPVSDYDFTQVLDHAETTFTRRQLDSLSHSRLLAMPSISPSILPALYLNSTIVFNGTHREKAGNTLWTGLQSITGCIHTPLILTFTKLVFRHVAHLLCLIQGLDDYFSCVHTEINPMWQNCKQNVQTNRSLILILHCWRRRKTNMGHQQFVVSLSCCVSLLNVEKCLPNKQNIHKRL